MGKRGLKRRKGDFNFNWDTIIFLTILIAALALLLRLYLKHIFPSATGVS